MKQPWDPVSMNVLFWHGPAPVPGDELKTSTGRRYLIQSYDGKRIKGVVLPKDAEPTDGKVFDWVWGSRKKRA